MKIHATAGYLRVSRDEARAAAGAVDLDVSLEIGTETSSIVLMVGQVSLCVKPGQLVDVYGGIMHAPDWWVSGVLLDEMRMVLFEDVDFDDALVALRKAALEAYQRTGGRHAA